MNIDITFTRDGHANKHPYLELRPAIVTPYTVDVGVAYRITPYTTKKSRSHGGFLRRSQGHQQFSSAVTRSLAVFGRSQIVTPVATLSTAHIGVTTPCFSDLPGHVQPSSDLKNQEIMLHLQCRRFSCRSWAPLARDGDAALGFYHFNMH